MRLVLQRVLEASVRVPPRIANAAAGSEAWVEAARIGPGLLVLAGFAGRETAADLAWAAAKIAGLRIFGAEGGFERGVVDVGGEILLVSQFTLLADVRKGRRPDFVAAAPAAEARPLYEAFAEALAARCPVVRSGVFGAPMRVTLVNDGPVTLVLDR